MKYSACIEMLFCNLSLKDRIKKAKEFGFNAIEFWHWKNKDLNLIKKECKKNELEVSSFIGIIDNQMVDPKDEEKCVEEFKESLNAAIYLNCKNLVLHVNTVCSDLTIRPTSDVLSSEEKESSIVNILNIIITLASKFDITTYLEPLNVIRMCKGYFLTHSKQALNIIEKIDSKNLKLLYDIYHLQIMEGNIISTIEENIDLIGYIHIADVPERHEPGTGEINFENIYKKLLELDYNGYVGFEYIPSMSTEYSLAFTKKIFNF